jgi:aryl-alcohol dehydrogenase-like predicted oxidoreductase
LRATDKVEIGMTGLRVSRLGLGGVALSGAPPAVAEVEDNVRMVEFPIPTALWAELKQAGLIAEAAPTPR